MAHQFETGFFADATPAWHGLGTVVEGQVTNTQEAIKLAGLDWNVVKRQHSVELPGSIDEATGKPEMLQSKVPDSYGIYRESDNSYLGHVGARYTPLQNRDAFDWFEPFLHDGNVYIETAGSLKAGRVIWILARLKGTEGDVVSGDTVQQRLLLSNSHDGSVSAAAAFTNTRVVCANTLAIATGEYLRSGNFMRFKHTANLKDKLAEAQHSINLARRNFTESLDIYKELANREMTVANFRETLETMFAKDLAKKDSDDKPFTLDTFDPTSKILRNLEATPDLQVKGVRGTAWGAYNAITKFYTHDSRSRSQDNRLNGLWFGDAKNQIEKAQDLLLAV